MSKFLKLTSGKPIETSVNFTDLVGSLASTQMPALTGDVTSSAGSVATTIANSAVTNAKMANMAAHTYKGNNTGSSAAPIDVTSTQLTADLNQFTSSLQGLVPSSGGGTTNFLRADGTWAAPSGGGGSTAALTKSIAQSSHGFSVGNVLYYTGSTYALAKADVDSTSEVLGIVTTVTDANNFVLTVSGYASGLSGLTAGTVFYLSDATAGALTSTAPTAVTHVNKPVLVADSTTSGYVIQSRGFDITANSSGTVSVLAARYTTAAGQSFNSNTSAIINFDTKDYDTGSSVATGTSWAFTAPVAGKYNIQCHVTWQGASYSSGNNMLLVILKNGSTADRAVYTIYTTATQSPDILISDTLNLVAGDTISIQGQNNDGSTHTLRSDATECWISISLLAGTISANGILGGINTAGSVVRGAIAGLILSNDSGTPNTVYDIAVGASTDTTVAAYMTLSSAFTKSLSAWAVGSGNGSLDTGSVAASTWYHVYQIARSDTGLVDILLSTSATSPTMPSGYSYKRRIGSIKTDGSSHILAFHQIGDQFRFDTASQDIDTTNPGTSAITATLNTPLGIVTEAIISFQIYGGASGIDCRAIVSALVSTNESPNDYNQNAGGYSTNTTAVQWQSELRVPTNTSSQIRYRIAASASDSRVGIGTRGWIDSRGRFD